MSDVNTLICRYKFERVIPFMISLLHKCVLTRDISCLHVQAAQVSCCFTANIISVACLVISGLNTISKLLLF